MIRATREELRVGAIADVGAVEARGKAALLDLALGGRKLDHYGSEVIGEDAFWVDGGANRWVYEVVDDVI